MIDRNIQKIELDFEKTILYFISHIQCGKTLSEKIVKNINFYKGKFFTFLPSDIDLSKLFEFSYGGVIEPISYGDQTYNIEGVSEDFHPQQVINMDDECSNFMIEYMGKKDGNCVIVENYIMEVDDFHANINNVQMIPYKTEVYYFLDIHEKVQKSVISSSDRSKFVSDSTSKTSS